VTKLFGTDGVRGKANQPPMDSESVLNLGRALAVSLRGRPGRHRVLIGKDTRLSGYMLETALCSGISSMGVDVLLVGPLPTPGVAFMTRSMRADAGVMISASHNPYEDNGIKIFGGDGFKLDDALEANIEQLLKPGALDAHRAEPIQLGKAFRVDDALGRYIVQLKNSIDKATTLDGLKLVVDCSHGAAYRVAPQLFAELGAELVMVGSKPDGRNINDGVGSTNPELMARLVKEHRANVGIAFDGDADRVILCDERGRIVDGDEILGILATAFKKQGTLAGDAVVATVMSNLGLEHALKKEGITMHRADVGDRYVLLKMQELGLNLGGEQSGHIISLEHNTTGDGILTALLVLDVLVREQKPLSAYEEMIERCPQVLLNVQVGEKPPLDSVTSLQKALSESEQKLGDKGRVLLRYSGTEPKLRIMVEAFDGALCKSEAERLVEVARQALA